MGSIPGRGLRLEGQGRLDLERHSACSGRHECGMSSQRGDRESDRGRLGRRVRPSDSTADASRAAKPVSNPLAAPVDYLGATAAGKKTAERAAHLAPVVAALQQFHAAEDRYPNRLQELVQAGFLARVPEAPAGQALSYNPNDGSVRWVSLPAR